MRFAVLALALLSLPLTSCAGIRSLPSPLKVCPLRYLHDGRSELNVTLYSPHLVNFEEILKLLMGSAGALAALTFAVAWMNRDRDKLLKALTEERSSRILALEDSSKRCADDRVLMHNTINQLQAEVRGLYRRMLRMQDDGDGEGS